MKTIEEKAKAYDEAVKKVKDYYEGKTKMYSDVNKTLNLLFPELAESEDERIRKAILTGLIDCRDAPDLGWSNFGGVNIDECIAWLEKQRNTIPDECVFRPVAGCDIESAAKQAIKQQGVLAKEIVLAFNGAYIPVGGKAADIIVNEYESWLEKQSESHTKRDVDDAYVEGVCDTKQELEKQSGQKSQRMVSEEAKEAFCKATCNGHPPRSTCTSLGTCKEYDNFVKFMKGE